jgi:hypothetical protein
MYPYIIKAYKTLTNPRTPPEELRSIGIALAAMLCNATTELSTDAIPEELLAYGSRMLESLASEE